jgi:membrane associated rhomboid family serine protease
MKMAIGFLAWMWAVYILNWIIPIDFESWGLIPRSLWGLVGILTSPFLHGSLAHIISNTIPIFILMILISASNLRAAEIVGALILAGGGLLWVFGTSATHIGASGLVYGLAAYLVTAGLTQKRFIPLAASLITIFLYWSLIWGILPTQPGVSWDGHLFGAIGGILVAIGLKPDLTDKEHRPEFLKEMG